MSTSTPQRSIIVILSSVAIAWALTSVATYLDLFVSPVYEDGMYVGENPAIRWSTYFFFAAVATVALAAIVAQRIAITARKADGVSAPLPRAAHRFATLTIILSLAAAAIFGVVVFASGFGGVRTDDIGLRFATTYLPILLYTALIVAVLLVGFVFRRDNLDKLDPAHPADTLPPESGHSARALGAAYAVPIIAGAVALIFGLIVYDLTQTRLEMWIWVIIHALIATGVVMGTIFAHRAQSPSSTSPTRVTRSAKMLNFVFSVVFIAVVLSMAFGAAASAVNGLRVSPNLSVDVYPGASPQVGDVVVSVNGWDLEPGTSVTVVWDATGETLITGVAGSFREFYDQVLLPSSTPPGTYSVTGTATAYGGETLTHTTRFTISSDLLLDFDTVRGNQWVERDAIILPPSGSWFIRDLAPTLVILIIGLTATFLTLVYRNRQKTATESM